jgi:hypothetical protein
MHVAAQFVDNTQLYLTNPMSGREIYIPQAHFNTGKRYSPFTNRAVSDNTWANQVSKELKVSKASVLDLLEKHDKLKDDLVAVECLVDGLINCRKEYLKAGREAAHLLAQALKKVHYLSTVESAEHDVVYFAIIRHGFLDADDVIIVEDVEAAMDEGHSVFKRKDVTVFTSGATGTVNYIETTKIGTDKYEHPLKSDYWNYMRPAKIEEDVNWEPITTW